MNHDKNPMIKKMIQQAYEWNQIPLKGFYFKLARYWYIFFFPNTIQPNVQVGNA